MQDTSGYGESLPCIVCAASARSQEHYQPRGGRRFTRFACAGCGLQFWDPRPLHRELYELEGGTGYGLFHAGAYVTRPAHDCFLERPARPGARLLDVGCGNGTFLGRARALGYEVWGIDFDRLSIASAKKHHALDHVFAISVEELRERFADTRFDVVTCFEVLEHLPDPLDFIGRVSELLGRGGLFAGSVPNAQRVFARFDRRVGDHDMPPHHFTWWSDRALRGLLRAGGFRPERVVTVDQLPFHEYVRHVRSYVLAGPALRAIGRRGDASAPAADRWTGALHRPSLAHHIGRAALSVAALPLAVGTLRAHQRHGKTLYFEATP